MHKELVSSTRLPDFALWNKLGEKRVPFSFDLEVTARCNNNCRHCCINLPQDDKAALQNELTLDEISLIADQAVTLGSLWCLMTGGEPLIRKDFFDIYSVLKKKGLLVSVFTNACLVTDEHIRLFKAYPPRGVEVTVYGATAKTYEGITRVPGSYGAFRHGLDLLTDGGIRVTLKAMTLRSNLKEFPAIARFCRARTKDIFRFDPVLHLRFDGDRVRNRQIRAERLSADETIAIEQADPERSVALKKKCALKELPISPLSGSYHLFQCGAGWDSFAVSSSGFFRLCPSLWHQDCLYDLRRGTLAEAWYDFTPRVRDRTTMNRSFIEYCSICELMDLCSWCPAHAYLECGQMDQWCEYFCRVTHMRAKAFKKRGPLSF